jgi:hypothetical protein
MLPNIPDQDLYALHESFENNDFEKIQQIIP